MNAKKISLQHQPGALDPSYLLTYFLEPMKAESTFVDWPLHITIIPWFFVKDINKLDSELSQLADKTKPAKVVGASNAKFSERTVCIVEPEFQLGRVHRAIYSRLKQHNATFIDERFFGDNYTPHVTEQGKKRFDVGQVAKITNFYLVKRYREATSTRFTKTIVREYTFND